MAAGAPAPPPSPPQSPAAVVPGVAAFGVAPAELLRGDRAGGIHGRERGGAGVLLLSLGVALAISGSKRRAAGQPRQPCGVAGVSRWEEDQAGDKFVRDDAGRQHSKLPGKSQASWLGCDVRLSCNRSQSWCTIPHSSLIDSLLQTPLPLSVNPGWSVYVYAPF